MSHFAALKDATAYVARLTGRDTNGDPSFGTPEQIGVRYNQGADVTRDGDGNVVDVAAKLSTDEWEFESTDAVWVEGTDETDVTESANPEAVGTSTTLGVTVSTAEL